MGHSRPKDERAYHLNSSPRQLANLRRFDQMSPEERREMGRRGGLAGGKKAREKQAKKKTFKEAAEWFLELPAIQSDNEAVEKLRAAFPDLSNIEAMTVAVGAKTIRDGDAKAFSVLRDTTGELPAQTVNVQNAEPMTITIKTVE